MADTERNSEQETKPSAATRPEEAMDKSDAAAEGVANAGTEASAQEQIDDLTLRLGVAEQEVARLKDEYLRSLAEMENVRRRAQRDRQEASQYAITGFARDLLSVADNLRRALGSVTEEIRASDAVLDALISGVEITERELLATLERHGVKPILAEGQPFDPHVHEALFEIPDESVPHGTVLQVMQSGYAIQDRTLRPARVGISRGGPRAGAPAGPDEGVIEFPRTETKPGAYRKAAESEETMSGQRIDESL